VYELLKPILFSQDPEQVHDQVMQGLAWLARRGPMLRAVEAVCSVRDPLLGVEVFGLRFPNPIGLAAGFDKNALALRSWPALGFGFVEIGSVTALAQEGNPKPRLFRLPAQEALINRMGFNNQGAQTVAQRLHQWKQDFGPLATPLGINLGKSKLTPLEEAPQDYLQSLEKLWAYGDYFVLNVSSPNTPGLRELQDKDKLEDLLVAVTGFVQQRKPLLLKIAPDLEFGQIEEIVQLVHRFGLAGIIATNTTLARGGIQTTESGGLSGAPLNKRALEILQFLRSHTPLPLISVGGIATPADVIERLKAGASLVQLYTSFVYKGPWLLRYLNSSLLRELRQASEQV
jgi:dihydroorotate dehydrogenase